MRRHHRSVIGGRLGPRARRTLLVLVGLSALAFSCSNDGNGTPLPDGRDRDADPAPELVVVTVNAHQFTQDLARLRTLSRALSEVPTERAPDVVFLQEIEGGSVEVLSGLLKDKFPDAAFEPAGPLDKSVKSKAIVNVAENELRDTAVWTDACDERNRYLALRLTNRSEREAYTVAGVHIPWDSEAECRRRNALLIKDTVGRWDDPAVVAGDFNQRAVSEQRECDLNETSEPQPWWAELVSGEGSSSFADAVKVEAQRRGDPVGEQWTYEGIGPTELCDGTTMFRRNRIDYIFVRGMNVIGAGADDPGWAGRQPGTYRCDTEVDCRYSDHRFVWARLGLGG